MTPQQKKADELVERFKIHCYCYLGSGMLTNEYNEEVQTKNAIQCAIICVEEILKTSPIVPNDETPIGLKPHEYWQSVLNELKSRV